MKTVSQLLLSKTVIGAIVAILGPIAMKYVGIGGEGLAEIVQALGAILAVVGARHAIEKSGPR